MKIRLDEFDGHVRIEIMRGHDIHHHQLPHAVRMIEGHATPDAPAPIVANHEELPVAEVLHDIDAVLRHGPLRVIRVPFPVGRLAESPYPRRSHITSVKSFASSGAIRRQVIKDCGAPWNRRTGGPAPPITALISAPEDRKSTR